ncbi:exopolysaccharide biosynthesis polyprenyl glycosylphosphotransferase [Sulfurimonas sp.]|uniref:exopolysaccharide biosynthesis polyprenyl glycosylphosphotransferase n=1 Tax=Sulfurimonas sp. TaxID=2022749 RepID=UPI0026137FDB|nr:exopolysaccharide biosynthesis polyprenyl glycosylphosphotransferase [Sulfurimonas sp.]
MIKKYFLNSAIIIIDILLLVGIFYLTQYVRVELSNTGVPVFNELSLQRFSFVIIITVAIMFYEKIYTLQYDFWQETYRVLKSLFLAYFIVLALLTLQKTSLEYSRLFITLYFLFAMLLLPIAKRLTKRVIYNFSFFKKRVLIIGDATQVTILKNEFEKNWYLGMKPSQNNYDMVIISSKSLELEKMNAKIEKYLDDNGEVYVVPYVTSINFANSNIMEYSNIRYNTIQIQNKLLIKRNIWIKNGFDLFVALIILPLFLIIHTVITFAIKLDSKGSILFRQERLGKNNKIFLCYKYRTMYENSENLLREYLTTHPEEVEYYKEFHKYKNDPRITKVGKFLRTTSLDELAQIINVLKADMSLIGPRPYMLNESKKLGDNKHFILKVRPGITGLWQVSGRNNLTFKERNELEVWYIKNWSLWADFVILIKTIKVVLAKVGAK